jgi:hypothetical protein
MMESHKKNLNDELDQMYASRLFRCYGLFVLNLLSLSLTLCSKRFVGDHSPSSNLEARFARFKLAMTLVAFAHPLEKMVDALDQFELPEKISAEIAELAKLQKEIDPKGAGGSLQFAEVPEKIKKLRRFIFEMEPFHLEYFEQLKVHFFEIFSN